MAPESSRSYEFELEVDGDRNWLQEGSYPQYYIKNPRIDDFIHRPGRSVRTFVLYLPGHFSTILSNEQLLDCFRRRGLLQPSLASTNTALDFIKANLTVSLIVGVCGVVRVNSDGDSVVGCVRQDGNGRGLYLSHLNAGWDRHSCFLAELAQ